MGALLHLHLSFPTLNPNSWNTKLLFICAPLHSPRTLGAFLSPVNQVCRIIPIVCLVTGTWWRSFWREQPWCPSWLETNSAFPGGRWFLSRDAQESSIWSVLDLPRKYRRAEYDWGSLGARSLRQTHHDYWRSLTASSISGTRRQKAAKTEVSSMCQL